ncbi:MAG TPA: TrmH family RNA methyltransferase, partial [Actinomycetota bacterium]|nr:TrmH family RNA methyltransferase [Actinomycetota bacterium]
ADASGAAGVVFTTSSVDVYNQKTVRATAGSLFHLPVAREVDVEEAVTALRAQGFALLAADAEGTRSVYEADLSVPTAVLFGNEAQGLSASALALADQTVRVPISGQAESLNLAAAGTLVLFEAARQRAAAGGETDNLSRIVAGAAHDIRSPLTAMKGFTATLLSRWQRLDDEQRLAMIEGVAGDAFRMEAIIAQVVDAARMQAGTLDLAPEPTDLQEVAKKIEGEVGRWAQAEVEVAGSPVVALVDPTRLRTMLLALIESAQWWGETGPVRVETSDDPVPTVVVRRAGSKLEPTVREGLFQPRMPGSGSGSKVGLYVAKGLAEAHGGSVDADTAEGISFILRLPRGRP